MAPTIEWSRSTSERWRFAIAFMSLQWDGVVTGTFASEGLPTWAMVTMEAISILKDEQDERKM